MRVKTDLQQVKSVAKAMLFLDFEETEYSPVIVRHPFNSTGFVMLHGENKLVNILEDEEGLKEWRKAVSELIDKVSTPLEIYNMLTKPYILSFVSLVEQYLSRVDLSLLWGDAWTRLEFITNNGVMTSRKMVGIFRKCDPAILMDFEELERFEDLADEIVIYRGIRAGSKKIKGMSWSTDIGVAKWFSNRFSSKGKPGEIYEARVGREYVLACFNSRSEHEIVVDPKGLRDLRRLELHEIEN